ncbi:MAG: exodeoxyribonuclease V subunit gamma [Phycisphaerae bacterium]|nr:exodeoxyribonuclease V subunit gamma [Phycisphaerae bacterium]
MAVKFIAGTAGSGKTRYCIDDIIAELMENPQGDPLIFITPGQSTFQMEQAILADGRIPGYHRLRVLSFERLAMLILEETGCPNLPVLSNFSKEMVLGRLLQRHKDELKVFARAASGKGFGRQLSAMLSELCQYGKSSNDLTALRDEITNQGQNQFLPLADKLHDLSLLQKNYREYIAGKYIDPDDYLDMLSLSCGKSSILKNATIWFDGFAYFTPQQIKVLLSLIDTASDCYITMCLDHQSPQFKAANNPATELEPLDVFFPTLQTWQRLTTIFNNYGVQTDPPIYLPRQGQPTRFESNLPIKLLEQNIFKPANRQHDTELTNQPDINNTITILKAPDRRREVDAIANKILRLCQQKDYHFSDIAVIARDIELYKELLESSFSQHGIPYFIDARRPINKHPLITFIRSALQIVASGYRSEYVFGYLKSDLLDIERKDIDKIQNYCLDNDINGADWLDDKFWGDSGFSELKSIIIEPLRKLAINCTKPESTVKEVIYQLTDLIENLGIQQKLEVWIQQAKDDGKPDQAQEHQQVSSQTTDLLDEISACLGEVQLSLLDFMDVLIPAMDSLTLPLVPPALDQVLIGSVDRSRQPGIKAAFIPGVNEGIFPKVVAAETFLTDQQRQFLRDKEFQLAPDSTEKLFSERYFAYIALTRASEFIQISYANSDDDGKALNRSLLIERIKDACPNLVETVLPDDDSNININNISSKERLGLALTQKLAVIRNGQIPEAEWLALWNYFNSNQSQKNNIDKALAGIFWNNKAGLDDETIARLYPGDLTGSITRLETFANCPFRYFSAYGLKLKEKESTDFSPLDIGNFYHEAIYIFYKQMRRQGINWQSLTDEQLDEIVDSLPDMVFKRDKHLGMLYQRSSRDKYMFDEMIDEFRKLCLWLREVGKASDFTQEGAELEFGADKILPSLTIDLGNGRNLTLRGKIDRLDLCPLEDGSTAAIVIDYKTSEKSFSFSDLYYGRALQLISYLLVLQNNPDDNITPVAGFYLPLKSNMKAKGLFDGDVYDKIDKVTDSGWSSYYSVQVSKKDAAYSGSNKTVLKPEQMQAVLNYCQSKLADLGQNIINGNIDIHPAQSGTTNTCQYCPYNPLCRFEQSRDEFNNLANFNRDEFLKRI